MRTRFDLYLYINERWKLYPTHYVEDLKKTVQIELELKNGITQLLQSLSASMFSIKNHVILELFGGRNSSNVNATHALLILLASL